MNFNYIVEQLIKKYKPTSGKTVAILPGGFKPPHKGHFNALNYILDEADSGIVFIGKGVRDGITAEQSRQIWEIYKTYLKKPVEIKIAEKTPVVSTYEYVDQNPNQNIIVGAGPEDERRFNHFKQNIQKYPLVKIINIPAMNDRISGTAVRAEISKKSPNAVNAFIPVETENGQEKNLLSSKDKAKISKILKI